MCPMEKGSEGSGNELQEDEHAASGRLGRGTLIDMGDWRNKWSARLAWRRRLFKVSGMTVHCADGMGARVIAPYGDDGMGGGGARDSLGNIHLLINWTVFFCFVAGARAELNDVRRKSWIFVCFEENWTQARQCHGELQCTAAILKQTRYSLVAE